MHCQRKHSVSIPCPLTATLQLHNDKFSSFIDLIKLNWIKLFYQSDWIYLNRPLTATLQLPTDKFSSFIDLIKLNWIKLRPNCNFLQTNSIILSVWLNLIKFSPDCNFLQIYSTLLLSWIDEIAHWLQLLTDLKKQARKLQATLPSPKLRLTHSLADGGEV